MKAIYSREMCYEEHRNKINQAVNDLQPDLKIKRGRERIRTAVEGFADLCLATRLRDRGVQM